MKKLLLLCLSIYGVHPMQAQHCGSPVIENQIQAKDPDFNLRREQIEQFTEHYLQHAEQAKGTRATIYRIPVVVHVIHNGQSIGTGANISNNQVYSQIAILNKDYRKKNTDSLATSHAFYSTTADCEIEFCLAGTDPSGNYTSGIDRVNGGLSSYDYTDMDGFVKQNTIWDRDRYLNIWVAPLGGSASSILGYATPPGSPSDVDGVVVGTTYFGNVGNVSAPYNKGRTATHEIGHFLNLRHIWGDNFCGNDFVSDTQPAEDANYGCPSFPYNANNSCGAGVNGEMYMNYMDYTDDACMKMFTTGQKNRMRAVLASGGSRNSLTTSNTCNWPTAIQEVQEKSFKLFPNPANGHFYIQGQGNFESDTKVLIYNTFGQSVNSLVEIQPETPNRYYLETGNLLSGTYYVQVVSGNQSFTHPFTIVH